MASLKELFHAYAIGRSQEEMQVLFNETNPIVLQVFYSHLVRENTPFDVERNRLIAALQEMRLLSSQIHSSLAQTTRRD